MHGFYNFVSGPLVWVAFAIFIGGSAYRIASLLRLAKQKESFLYEYWSWKYALRSIFFWTIPLGSWNWRLQPVMNIVTWLFHFCLIFTPLFLGAHLIMLKEGIGISWWSLPDAVADIMTWIVVAGALYFLYRRLFEPQVKFVTSASDFLILAIAAAPFVTGILAYHQWMDYQTLIVIHILAGELMLIAIPFTRLSHMLYAPLVRGYTGSEFGGIRHVKDF